VTRNPQRSEFFPSIRGQSIYPYFLSTFTLLEKESSVFLFSFPSLPFSTVRAPKATPRRKTRRDFHSIVPRPSCAWLERVALGTGIAIIRSAPPVWDGNEEQEGDDERGSFLSRFSPVIRLIYPLFLSVLPSVPPFHLLLCRAPAKRKEDEEWKCDEENTIHRGLLPPYRNTPVCAYSSLGGDWKRRTREGRREVGWLRVKVASRVQPHQRRNIRHCRGPLRRAGNCLPLRPFSPTVPWSHPLFFPSESRGILYALILSLPLSSLFCLRQMRQTHSQICNKSRALTRFSLTRSWHMGLKVPQSVFELKFFIVARQIWFCGVT